MGVWEAIINEWEELRCRVHFMVGNGRRIKFWKYLWCEELTLKEAFPNLFRLTVNQDGWVVEAWEEGGDLSSWSPRFSRHLND